MKVGVLQTECQRNCSCQINLSKTHVKWQRLLNIKGLRWWPNPRMSPNGLQLDTQPIGPKWWRSTKIVLEIGIVLMIMDDFDFGSIWDRCHWKGYLFIFPCICRTSKMEILCNLDVNLNTRWSWTLSWTRTRQFWIGLVRHLLMHISLALQHLLDVPYVLHGPLLDS
jgi:hypothetical protein